MNSSKHNRKLSRVSRQSGKGQRPSKTKTSNLFQYNSMDFDPRSLKGYKKFEGSFMENEQKEGKAGPDDSFISIYTKQSVYKQKTKPKKPNSEKKVTAVSQRFQKRLASSKTNQILENIVKIQKTKGKATKLIPGRFHQSNKKYTETGESVRNKKTLFRPSQSKTRKQSFVEKPERDKSKKKIRANSKITSRKSFIDKDLAIGKDPDTLTKELRSKSKINNSHKKRDKSATKKKNKREVNCSLPAKKRKAKLSNLEDKKINGARFNLSGYINGELFQNDNPREVIFNRHKFDEIKLIKQYISEFYKKQAGFDFKTKLEFYEVDKLIGKGECGKVYSATHKLTGKKVAIKSIEKTTIKNSETMQRIFNELDILSALKHENVIKLYEIFENPKYFFFITEYCEKGDLLKLLRQRDSFKEEQIFIILKDLLKAVDHVHSNGVFHRDIKLDNVLITNEFKIKLCDFGMSKKVKPGELLNEKCGTTAYMAPEVISEEYTPYKADVS